MLQFGRGLTGKEENDCKQKARLVKDAPEARRTIESELNKRLGFGLRIQYTKKRVT
nr:MAG TPA: hypothetical protein [Caudoviricetes sp.]